MYIYVVRNIVILHYLPWISQVGLLSHPDSVQFKVELPVSEYPSSQEIVASWPSVVPELATATPFMGDALPQSAKHISALSHSENAQEINRLHR